MPHRAIGMGLFAINQSINPDFYSGLSSKNYLENVS